MLVKLRYLTHVLFVVSCIISTACSTAPTTNENQRNSNATTAQANSSQANSSQTNSSQTKSAQTKSAQTNSSSKPSQPGESTTGSIEVTSVPPGARVLLISTDPGGAGEPQSKGATPTTITGLQPGKYTVDLEKPGYRSLQKDVVVKQGSTTKVTASLKKQ